MRRLRGKILFMLIVYFSGFATAIYTLSPGSEEKIGGFTTNSTSRIESLSSGFESEKFTEKMRSGVSKCLSFAGEKSVQIRELIKAELSERQSQE